MVDPRALLIAVIVGTIWFAGLGVVRGTEFVAKKTAHGVMWVVHHVAPHHPHPDDDSDSKGQ